MGRGKMKTLTREYDVIQHPDGSFAITCTSTIKFVLIDGFPDRARAEAYIGKIQVEDRDRDLRPRTAELPPRPGPSQP